MLSFSFRAFSNACLIFFSMCAFCGELFAIAPDACKNQRASFPRHWNYVAAEKLIMKCHAKYARMSLRAGRPDKKGNRIVSLAVGFGKGALVFRQWVGPKTYGKLIRGQAAALFLRSEKSCFIRGNTAGVAYFRANLRGGDLLINGEHNLINQCELASRP